jgi:DNA-binding response OmpR family regulator
MSKQSSILVIDDDLDVLETLNLILESDGFSVRKASSGDDAFVILKSFIPDIILLDITMPKMDGFEICKILKSNRDTKHIPVIFLTGVGSEFTMKLQSLMVGGVDYICKPYEHEELLEKIKIHLGKNKGV